jgi:hypothetical protein
MEATLLERLVYVMFLHFMPKVTLQCLAGQIRFGADAEGVFSYLVISYTHFSKKGGVIMDVINAEQVRATYEWPAHLPCSMVDQARIAEEAGACAVMALERVPADIRAEGMCYSITRPEIAHRVAGGVARMVWLALTCIATLHVVI